MSPPNNQETHYAGDHPYCEKVLNHDRELGGVQAYLKTIIDGQKKLFERTDELCEMHVARDTEEKSLRSDLSTYKDNLRDMISEELNKGISTALDNRRGTEERTSKSTHERDEAGIEIAKGPLSGFLDRSWNKFIENIGPIVITLFLWWIVWALSKSKIFKELGIFNFLQ